MSSLSNTMSGYKWYEECSNIESITQGDILENCPAIMMVPCDDPPFYKGGVTTIPKVIVVTQACDLARGGKVDDVALCPVGPLSDAVKGIMEKEYEENAANQKKNNPSAQIKDFDYTNLSSKQRERKAKIIEEIRKGNYLDYYLLSDHNTSTIHMTYQVVHLRKTYYVPLKVLNNIYSNRNGNRIQLLPPYREHLAQAYARNFMRIGLPIDLKIDPSTI